MIEESLVKIRRRLEEFERERGTFSDDRTSREQFHRTQLDELSAEKEYEHFNPHEILILDFSTYWQQRLDEESNRLREQLAKLQSEYDEQSQTFSQQLQTVKSQNDEHCQVGEEFHHGDSID